MQLSEVARALNLDRHFLQRRVEQLRREADFCQQLLDSMAETDIPQAGSMEELVFAGQLLPQKRTHRLSRDDYFDATVEYLSTNGPATAGKIYEHLRVLGKRVSYDSVAAFLRREYIRHKSRIAKDPDQSGVYVLKKR